MENPAEMSNRKSSTWLRLFRVETPFPGYLRVAAIKRHGANVRSKYFLPKMPCSFVIPISPQTRANKGNEQKVEEESEKSRIMKRVLNSLLEKRKRKNKLSSPQRKSKFLITRFDKLEIIGFVTGRIGGRELKLCIATASRVTMTMTARLLQQVKA